MKRGEETRWRGREKERAEGEETEGGKRIDGEGGREKTEREERCHD